MKCEKCNKDHDGNFGSGIFCSRSCANKRVHSSETLEKISNSCKKLWKDEKFRDKTITATKNNGGGWRKEAGNKGRETQKKLREEKYKQYIIEGKYELVSKAYRRKTILKEVEYKCESCKNSHWLGKPIWLEIHHIDDDGTNNKRENLMVVCPNCYSVIEENYRSRGRKFDT